MFGKSLEKAQQLEKQLRERELQKEYVCKVRGEFPSSVIDCSEPIVVVSHKVGVCRVHVDGKPCRTVFSRESFDGTNSIVKCQPYTGRMHQIRVHLQWLGYPIVDDPIYNHEAWGLTRGKGGVEEEKAWKVIESIATSLRNNDAGKDTQPNSEGSSTLNKENTLTDEKSGPSSVTVGQVEREILLPRESEAVLEKDGEHSEKVEREILLPRESEAVLDNSKSCSLTLDQITSSTSDIRQVVQDETRTHQDWKQDLDPGCTECRITRRDPTPAELTMCLHAALYKGPDWEFRCPWPSWALPNMDTQSTE